MDADSFLLELRRFYEENGRHDMLWRQPSASGDFDPYRILVSELMLQQTQVSRVTPKYAAFLERFPSVSDLADAPLGEVLVMWSGLGYNRRAKFLHQASGMVTRELGGVFPRSLEGLVALPGVGPGTAGAIMAYAYDSPVMYLETNIRTVLIHHFFGDAVGVGDTELREVLSVIVSLIGEGRENLYFTPREFYWAMMDYGTFLKRSVGNLNRQSRAYTRQSAFEGSRRQVRGAVLRILGSGSLTFDGLASVINDSRLESVVADLVAEGLIISKGGVYTL